MKLFKAALASLPLSGLYAYELTTPYGSNPNAWAVCDPSGASDQYVWTRNDDIIDGIKSRWYLLQTMDDGQLLRCGVAGDMSPAVRIGAAPSPIAPTPAPVSAPFPAPVGSPVGVSLDAPWGTAVGKWTICNVDPTKYTPLSFSWTRGGTALLGETNMGHKVSQEDVGLDLMCKIATIEGIVPSPPLQIGSIYDPYPTSAPVDAVPTTAPQTIAPVVTPSENGKLDILDFSPHLAGDTPYSILPDETIHERVDLVSPYTNGIRTFACYNGAETIRYAKSLGMRTAAGAWMNSQADSSQAELDCLITLAKEGVVDLAVVGSEVVTWNGLTASEIIAYINYFRSEVPTVPVTTAIKYEALLLPENSAIIDAVDIVYVNIYPFWSGYHIDDALGFFIEEYNNIKDISNGKDVWISETGWPSDGSCANVLAVPNAANQERYLREVMEWASNEAGVVVSWFDGFEQLYKDGSEWCNVASHWGLFDAYGNIKPGPARVLA